VYLLVSDLYIGSMCSVEHITVTFRFLCTILKEGAGDVFVWRTETCRICQTHQQGHYQYMQPHHQ